MKTIKKYLSESFYVDVSFENDAYKDAIARLKEGLEKADGNPLKTKLIEKEIAKYASMIKGE